MKMTYDEALRALESVAQNIPNRPSCWCCGYEHNCDRDGCALLESAKAVMEQLYKDASDLCDTCIYSEASMAQPPCNDCECSDPFGTGGANNWQWRGVVEAPDLPSPGAFSDPS